MHMYEPCCKLSCTRIVSWFEVIFKHGFEGFTSKTIGDSLNNDTPETYMWEVQDMENDRDFLIYPKHTAFTIDIHHASASYQSYIYTVHT